jgi:hypothetical protein
MDAGGGTTCIPVPASELPRPLPPDPVPPSIDGAGGTTRAPVPDSEFRCPLAVELPSPPPEMDGAGAITCEPVPDKELARLLPVEGPPSTDGAGGTTDIPAVDNELPRPEFSRLFAPEPEPSPMDGAGGTTRVAAPDSGFPRPVAVFPEPPTVGGGGTTEAFAPPRPFFALPDTAPCSCAGNAGAGATASECPMLTSPTLRIEPCTVGGGATTAEFGAATGCRDDPAPTSGAGATAGACGKPSRRAEA